PAAAPPEEHTRVLGIPAHRPADELVLRLLGVLLAADGVTLDVAPPGLLAAEAAGRLTDDAPRSVCIAAVAPGGITRTRYLVRLRRCRRPGPRLVAARPGPRADAADALTERLTAAGADHVALTLGGAVAQLGAQAESPAARKYALSGS